MARTASYIAKTSQIGGIILGTINKKQSNPYYVSKKTVRELKAKFPKAKAFLFTKHGGSTYSYNIDTFLKS